jgi:hypothetical protein
MPFSIGVAYFVAMRDREALQNAIFLAKHKSMCLSSSLT